jgi:hypothetical protein
MVIKLLNRAILNLIQTTNTQCLKSKDYKIQVKSNHILN